MLNWMPTFEWDMEMLIVMNILKINTCNFDKTGQCAHLVDTILGSVNTTGRVDMITSREQESLHFGML